MEVGRAEVVEPATVEPALLLLLLLLSALVVFGGGGACTGAALSIIAYTSRPFGLAPGSPRPNNVNKVRRTAAVNP